MWTLRELNYIKIINKMRKAREKNKTTWNHRSALKKPIK